MQDEIHLSDHKNHWLQVEIGRVYPQLRAMILWSLMRNSEKSIDPKTATIKAAIPTQVNMEDYTIDFDSHEIKILLFSPLN